MIKTIELVEWETVRRDMKLDKSDNNDGYTFGVYHIEKEEGDVIDVQWFKTIDDRNDYITKHDLSILDEF